MLNLNKIFPWLSIRNKLLIAFAGLSILPLAFVGIYSIVTNVSMMREFALADLTEDVRTIREKTENFLDDVYADIRVLQSSSFFEGWAIGQQSSEEGMPKSRLDQFAAEVLRFVKTKGVYYQFRLIGHEGDELLRVECVNPNDSAKIYHIVSPTQLRHARETYYFLLTKNIGRNQIALAPAELLHWGGVRVPVMTFAMPLFDRGNRVGILVADVFERKFIDAIEFKTPRNPTRRVVLITSDGNYLYRSEMRNDWNRLLASRARDNLQRDYPRPIVDALLSGRSGTLVSGSGEIISYAPLFSNDASMHSVSTPQSFALPVIVFESESASMVMGPVRSYAVTYAGFLMLFLVCAVLFALIATRQITGPIAKLQQGAEVIARGDYTKMLDVQTNDEIQKLAEQFDAMAASLRDREVEIQQHRSHLEEMVTRRTHELEEEKTKLQVLLDNVPSAFVLLDKDFGIQTLSAAFSNVTGLTTEQMKRSGRFRLVSEPDTAAPTPWEKAAVSGQIETFVEEVTAGGGENRFLEYDAIPLKESGKVNTVLVIITDITKRKRFEQVLIHTEKLAAAGEMSSIIAHEFRNALTSVKMILQLFVESTKLARSDKKSFNVALDSIYRMETVVTELLDFARPKAVKLTPTDVNKIVRESTEFVDPHLRKSSIDVILTLDKNLQELPLDESRMKEAIINLLLNSIQAFDGTGLRDVTRTVRVATNQARLQETIKDIAYAETADLPPGAHSNIEIVLKKDTECVLIEIRDNGYGIDKDHLQRIFDPFFTTKANGTGLGLPMVKRTVLAHGGVVRVESIPNVGTTFRIYIPTNHHGQAT